MVVADPNSPYASSSPGHALLVCADALASDLSNDLENLGYRTSLVGDPYGAFAELLERPLQYDAIVLSLPSLYRDELKLIRAVRERLNHLDVFLTHTDGRHAALAEAMRLGATGLLGEEGIHRLATPGEAPAARQELADPLAAANDRNERPSEPSVSSDNTSSREEEEAELTSNETILTADELRALLQEQPTLPPT